MKLNEIFENNEVILIVPKELKDYFFEFRKTSPFINFKLFTLDEIISNIKGSYLNKEVIKLGLKYFPDFSFSNIKEISKLCFHILDNKLLKNEKIIEFCRVLEEEKLIYENHDFVNLLKNRKLVFINYEDSSYVKNFLKHYEITNFAFYSLNEIFNGNENLTYHEFFNAGDEIKYSFNDAFKKINLNKKPNNIVFTLDLERYKFYLDLFVTNLNLPINFIENLSFKNTKIYKEIFRLINDDFNILSFLNENKDRYNPEEFDSFYNLLSFYEIDNLKNKKFYFNEIADSLFLGNEVYGNGMEITSNKVFSLNKEIYILGLDNSFLPKAKKDNKYFSYDELYSYGFDSLNEVNLMNSKLETAFIKQKNVKFISYHLKDNNGQYSPSYYISAFNLQKVKNEIQSEEYIADVCKLYYRNFYDKFKKSGIVTEDLKIFKDLYDKEIPFTYSSDFEKFSGYQYNEKTHYSYSSLKTYKDCPFAYFCDNILNLSVFEKNIYQKYGTLIHEILEHVYENEFDFDKAKDEALIRLIAKGEKIEQKEKILLNRFFDEVKNAVNRIILPHKKNMSFVKNYSELTLFTYEDVGAKRFLDGETLKIEPINYHTFFKGTIDSIVETSGDNIFIVDYKTGNDGFSKNNVLKYKLDLQLPTYIYLINNSNLKSFEGKRIGGAFLERVIASDARFYNYYHPSPEDFEGLKLNGAYLDDYDALLTFDYTINEENKASKFILGLETGKAKKDKFALKGNGKCKTKKSTMEDFLNFEKAVKNNLHNSVRGIANCNFEIEPFRKGKTIVGCTFCKNYDICFKRNKIEELE